MCVFLFLHYSSLGVPKRRGELLHLNPSQGDFSQTQIPGPGVKTSCANGTGMDTSLGLVFGSQVTSERRLRPQHAGSVGKVPCAVDEVVYNYKHIDP